MSVHNPRISPERFHPHFIAPHEHRRRTRLIIRPVASFRHARRHPQNSKRFPASPKFPLKALRPSPFRYSNIRSIVAITPSIMILLHIIQNSAAEPPRALLARSALCHESARTCTAAHPDTETVHQMFSITLKKIAVDAPIPGRASGSPLSTLYHLPAPASSQIPQCVPDSCPAFPLSPLNHLSSPRLASCTRRAQPGSPAPIYLRIPS